MTTRGKNTVIAYIAGLFDGEGHITLYRSNSETWKRRFPRYEIQIGVTNNDRNVIYWLKKLYGGSIRERFRDHPRWKTCYNWKLSSNQATDFLKKIRKYLRIKGERADIVIEFQERRKRKKNRFAQMTLKDYTYSEACWEAMGKLNSKGVHPQRLTEKTTEK